MGELSNTEKQQFAGVNVGSFFGEEKEDRLPSSSSPPACVPVCAVRVCVCASVSARAPRRSSGCAAWKPREPLARRRGGGGGSPSLGEAGARAAEASPEPRLLARAKAERGRCCGRPPGPGEPAGEELGRRPELHGVSRARNSGGASATGLRGAARQPRTWAEPARRGSARPAGAGGVEERAVPGCGARVPRREQRTRTGRSVPGSRSEPTRGSRRPGARLGSGPGRRGSRRQRGCRRGDAAAGWGCERQAERCPPAPAAAPPPPCGPRRKPPAPRGGTSEPGLRGSGPVRPAPAQPEVSAAARSRPPAPLAPASPLRPRPSPGGGAPAPERAAGRGQRLPYLLARVEGTGRAGGRRSHLALPWGGRWLPSRGRGAGKGRGCPARLSRTARAAGWVPVAESAAPGAARLRAPGRGRPGGGKQGEEREPHRSPGGRAGRLPGLQEAGVMAIRRGGTQDSLHLRPPARAARLPGRTAGKVRGPRGARGITREASGAQPGTWPLLGWPPGP